MMSGSDGIPEEHEMELTNASSSRPLSFMQRMAIRQAWLNGFQKAPQQEVNQEQSDRDASPLNVPLGNDTSRLHQSGEDSTVSKVSFSSSLEDDEDEFKKSDVELGLSESPTDPLTRNDSDTKSDFTIESVVCQEQEDEQFNAVLKDRAIWLVGLLVLQSCSSFILKRNEELMSHHMVIVRFLTMLVGAGGNAGNQASVRVIRGLAVGIVNDQTVKPFLQNELLMGLCLSAILGVAGCIRAAIFMTPLAETLAITASLVIIVVVSVAIGAVLPVLMNKVNIDPAHSSTTIQVLMDILGVTITLYVSGAILDSTLGSWLGSDGPADL